MHFENGFSNSVFRAENGNHRTEITMPSFLWQNSIFQKLFLSSQTSTFSVIVDKPNHYFFEPTRKFLILSLSLKKSLWNFDSKIFMNIVKYSIHKTICAFRKKKKIFLYKFFIHSMNDSIARIYIIKILWFFLPFMKKITKQSVFFIIDQSQNYNEGEFQPEKNVA